MTIDYEPSMLWRNVHCMQHHQKNNDEYRGLAVAFGPQTTDYIWVSTLAFELIQQAPPLFARSRSLGSICHTAKNSLRESEILAVLRKIRLIVSERKRGRRSIKLAGTAQTQFLCGDFFESTPIVRVQTGDMRKVPMTDGSSEKVPLTLLGLAKKFTSMKLGSLPYTHTNMEDDVIEIVGVYTLL